MNNLRKSLDVPQPIMVGGEAEIGIELQEQSVHCDRSAKSIATSKENWDAIADGLSQNVQNVKSQINLLQQEITAAEARVKESREALDLVLSPPKWLPPMGEFELFDQLQRVVAEQETEQERQQKLEQVQKAIVLGESLVDQKRKQIALLEAELRQFQEALSWATTYAPHIEKFEPSYRYPDPQQREIDRHTGYLWEAQQKLAKAKEAAEGSPSNIQKWLSATIYKSMNEAIATYEQVVSNEQQALATAQRRNDLHFKKYIVARVDIDQSLQEFLVAQEEYKKALEVFSPLIQKHGEVLGLTKENTLRFVNLNLPQVKDAEGRITVV